MARLSRIAVPGYLHHFSSVVLSPYTGASARFSIFPLLHPNLRLSMVEFHLMNRLQEISVTDRQIKALYILLPVPVPDYHVGCCRVDSAAHGVGFPGVSEVMHRWPRIDAQGFPRRSTKESCVMIVDVKGNVRLREPGLTEDWYRSEEDVACSHLQPER